MRNEWQFNYAAAELLSAAKARQSSHEAKLKWWTDKQAEVMQNIRASGIEIKDSVAAGYSATKGVFGPQVVVDPGMQRDLTECREKMRLHAEKIEEYKSWVQVLGAAGQAGALLSVDHDDWQFFFGP